MAWIIPYLPNWKGGAAMHFSQALIHANVYLWVGLTPGISERKSVAGGKS
jgi:hypothetical protein